MFMVKSLNDSMGFEVRHPRYVSNKSKCNVYAICHQTQFSTRWYANLLNANLRFTFSKLAYHLVLSCV
jgi:hypothetical protein